MAGRAKEGASLRIIGGGKAPEEFGKCHVSLQNLTGHHVCGGAIISRFHVLTAAHCTYRAIPEYIKVVIGTVDLHVGGLRYDVESIHSHKRYNATLKLNDIAILKIKGLFDLNKVKVLEIDSQSLKEHDSVFLAGFGAQEPHGESSRYLLALDLTVFNQETCHFAMRYTREVYNSMFCTFTKIGQGTCHGDSGGPLIKMNKLVGIVSWGIPCGVGFPDVHTRISPYVKWIHRFIHNNSNNHCKVKVEKH